MTYIEEVDLRELPLYRDRSLKQIMEELNPSKPVPISGGFGFTKEDAIIIENPHKGIPFDGVGLEAFVAKAKFTMEVAVLRQKGDRFRIFDIRKHKQSLVHGEGGNVYDYIQYVVTVASQAKIAALLEKLDKLNSEQEKESLYRSEIEGCLSTIECDVWFEISSFFGQQFNGGY